jgi:O-antigen ligase
MYIEQKKNTPEYLLTLFCIYILCLPLLRYSISVAEFGVTISDFILVFLLLFTYRFRNKIHQSQKLYLWTIVIYAFVIIYLALIKIISIGTYFANIFPLIYAILVTWVPFRIINHLTIEQIKKFKKYLNISMLITFIPIYLQVFVMQIPSHFFMFGASKYRYFAVGSNQYAMYLFTMMAISLFVSVKFFRNKLPMDLLVVALALPPVFYTGSRTGTLIFLGLAVLNILLIFFKKGNKPKIILVLVLIFGASYLQSFFEKGDIDWNIQRSLSFYEVFTSKDKISVDDWREEHNTLALNHFKEHPIIGVGIGNYQKIDGHEVHNSYISLLTESGFLGLMFYLFIIIYFTYLYLKYNKNVLEILYYIFLISLFLGASYSGLLLRERWIWMMFSCILSFSLYKSSNAVTANTHTEVNVSQ